MKPDHYTKRQLFQLVINELKGYGIHKYHIISIINIFLEEMVIEIKNGGKVKIGNFATFALSVLKPRRMRDIISGKMIVSKTVRAMRIKLDNRLKKVLIKESK